ncbi:MAG TPA: IS110 family transposase [Kofleriaceae bacterium]|nr:IS110 family transposase [Kofleriaceae bacterium]
MDVHARQTHATVLNKGSGELSACKLRGAPEEAVLPFLEGIGPGLLAVYEAGPTGFGLARAARQRGFDVRVVAPGSIPRAPGDRVKTDPRDSLRLLRLLAAGELSFVFVPSVEDERFRDLVRALDDLRGDLMRARHRLSKFLLRAGERYEQGRAWTARHMAWLRALSFEDACAQATLADYLSAVEFGLGRRQALIGTLERAVSDCSHAHTIARLRCFRGIETLSAAGLCAELHGFKPFPRPALVSGFVGIVPSERTSDTKRRQGSITKAGSGHARRLLVEAAHHYRHRPAVGDTLARRQADQDPRIIEIAWRAQRRLHQRWQRLHIERRKPSGVVAVAVARELAAFLWEAATLE